MWPHSSYLIKKIFLFGSRRGWKYVGSLRSNPATHLLFKPRSDSNHESNIPFSFNPFPIRFPWITNRIRPAKKNGRTLKPKACKEERGKKSSPIWRASASSRYSFFASKCCFRTAALLKFPSRFEGIGERLFRRNNRGP